MILSLEKLVSLETLQKFKVYERVLRDWNRRTALVQEDTLSDFYNRHILDSLQIIPILQALFTQESASDFQDPSDLTLLTNPLQNGFRLDLPSPKIANLSIIDIGTGAGFPGMVLAMCGFQAVTLCESNERKCIFLEEVSRQTSTQVILLNERIENVNLQYDIIVSRACNDLESLSEFSYRLCKQPSSIGVFHKGRLWQQEVEAAQKNWILKIKVYQSVTSHEGAIVCLNVLQKRKSIRKI